MRARLGQAHRAEEAKAMHYLHLSQKLIEKLFTQSAAQWTPSARSG